MLKIFTQSSTNAIKVNVQVVQSGQLGFRFPYITRYPATLKTCTCIMGGATCTSLLLAEK